MPAIIKLKNSQTSGNVPTLSNAGETGINEADGNFFFRNSNNSSIERANLRRIDLLFDNLIPYAMRSPTALHGGGVIYYDGTNVSWGTRFILVSNGRSSKTATNGYFDINMPPNGTVITGVGGASNQTVNSVGIPIGGFQCLYYIVPYESGPGYVSSNFRIASLSGDLIIPYNWLPLCWQNPESGSLNFNRFSLSPGDYYDTGKSLQSQISGRNASSQGRSLFFR